MGSPLTTHPIMTKNILLVDDDPQFNQLLADIFAHTNYKLITADDPKKALAILEKQTIELVVTDYRMPGLDGIAFMEEARAIRPQLIFIMISAFLDPATARSLINAGIGGVFTKPLNVFALLKCAVSLLEGHENYNAPAHHESSQTPKPNSLKTRLENFRKDYEQAVYILCSKDAQAAAQALAIPATSACFELNECTKTS